MVCTVIFDWRPEAAWPLVLAGNRDEQRARPWRPPARHWPEQADVLAPRDEAAGGTWIGLNDGGVFACVLNRAGTLGPEPGRRSRGELVLEALLHADAVEAARALVDLDGSAYRPFNFLVGDNRDLFYLRHGDPSGRQPVEAFPVAPGLFVLSASALNDPTDPRLAACLPRLLASPRPEPARGLAGWTPWIERLSDRSPAVAGEPGTALCFMTERGFGTICSTLLALPAVERTDQTPLLWFAPGPPDQAPYEKIQSPPASSRLSVRE